ncbi:NAD-dependent epimerase/dehydratase family protein [Candidatus Thorarchaeota archaeon]|nr:MAG: NAD-dependent epimerase/dehydratase family protein [Candidatus Thorarchaeota archaeon]
MMRRALVTGATGFIASHLVDALLSREHEVVGIDNLRTGKESNLSSSLDNDNFVFLQADVCDPDFEAMVGGNFDIVFHLAAISSVKMSVERPHEVNRINVTGTINTLDAACKLGAKRFVLTSSAAVYGDPKNQPVQEDEALDPLSPYAASKVAAEMYCRAFKATHGLDYTILRYFNVYGPRQAFSEYSGVISIFINDALGNRPIEIEGDGKQTRSFVYVDDVVDCTILAGERSKAAGEVINVSGLDSASITDLASMILTEVGTTESEALHVAPRIGDVRESRGSMDKAKRMLGFTPQVSLSDGISRTVDWFRAVR